MIHPKSSAKFYLAISSEESFQQMQGRNRLPSAKSRWDYGFFRFLLIFCALRLCVWRKRKVWQYMKTIGFIDYYLDEWHANNYPKNDRGAIES